MARWKAITGDVKNGTKAITMLNAVIHWKWTVAVSESLILYQSTRARRDLMKKVKTK